MYVCVIFNLESFLSKVSQAAASALGSAVVAPAVFLNTFSACKFSTFVPTIISAGVSFQLRLSDLFLLVISVGCHCLRCCLLTILLLFPRFFLLYILLFLLCVQCCL